jgi:hypothetical protein
MYRLSFDNKKQNEPNYHLCHEPIETIKLNHLLLHPETYEYVGLILIYARTQELEEHMKLWNKQT